MRRTLSALVTLAGLTACSGDDLANGTIEIEASDFTFSGLPEEIATGAELTVTNTAPTEVHEIVVLRIADGETRSLEELLELPDEETEDLTEFKGVLIALPGEDGFNPEGEGTSITIDQPGRYVVICFIPQGTTREIIEEAMAGPPTDGPPSLGDGAPHFVLGMHAEFTARNP